MPTQTWTRLCPISPPSRSDMMLHNRRICLNASPPFCSCPPLTDSHVCETNTQSLVAKNVGKAWMDGARGQWGEGAGSMTQSVEDWKVLIIYSEKKNALYVFPEPKWHIQIYSVKNPKTLHFLLEMTKKSSTSLILLKARLKRSFDFRNSCRLI